MRILGYGLILLIAAIILAPIPAAAQAVQRGRLTVTVADQTGAIIPNVTVTLDALEAAAKAALCARFSSSHTSRWRCVGPRGAHTAIPSR